MAQATQVGIEHEYQLRRGATPVDARPLLAALRLPGLRNDPGDPNALRTVSGVALTTDGAEAEVAAPPVAVAAGMARELDRVVRGAERLLCDALPDGLDALGCSTHLNVSAPTAAALAAAPLVARHFGVPLLLLTEQRDADGLLVRPRAGRLELGVDYCSGPARQAAAIMAAAAVGACVEVATGRRSAHTLPAPVDARVDAAVERFGWYLDRRACGPDLYAQARRTRVRLAAGGHADAQELLEQAWACAAQRLGPRLRPADLAPLARLVRGAEPLPLERPADRRPAPGDAAGPGSVFGEALRPRLRPGFATTTILSTWWVHVLRLHGARTAYAVVPTRDLRAFLHRLDTGGLDAPIGAYLARPPTGRTLRGWPDLGRTGLYDTIPAASAFVAPERDVTGALVPTWDTSLPPPTGAPATPAPPAPTPPAPGPVRASSAVTAPPPAGASVPPAAGGRPRKPLVLPPPGRGPVPAPAAPPPPGADDGGAGATGRPPVVPARPAWPWWVFAIALVGLVGLVAIAVTALTGGDGPRTTTTSTTAAGQAATSVPGAAEPSAGPSVAPSTSLATGATPTVPTAPAEPTAPPPTEPSGAPVTEPATPTAPATTTATPVPSTPTQGPTTAAPSTPVQTEPTTTLPVAPDVTGSYTGTITVLEDPAGHAPFVVPSTTWAVVQGPSATGSVVQLGGVLPGVVLVGEMPTPGEPFQATAVARVAGFDGVSVRFDGTVTTSTGVRGVLVVGENGALPQGQPIVFGVDLGTKVA